MKRIAIAVLLIAAVAACKKAPEPGAGPHAVVQLRDGTSVSGTVTSSTAQEIQIAGDDHIQRTIPMAQVRSVDYGDNTTNTAANTPPPAQPQAAAPAAAAPPPQPVTNSGTAAAPASVPEPASDPGVRPRQEPPSRPAVTTRRFTVPAGRQIAVRNDETIDSAHAAEGQRFGARVTEDVRDEHGNVVIPRGANAQIVIRSASQGGRFKGTSDLALDLASVSIDGQRYALDTADIVERGKEGVGKNKRTAEYTGGGAAVGAIIGAIAGHGKGAAIGALSGAGAGAATQILTKGGSIKVPAESVLTFRLERPLHVEAER